MIACSRCVGSETGLRDDGPLKSALAYADTPDIIDLAAACTVGIVRNHPFADGNKRTGFVAGILFLELNGYRFTASEEDAAKAVLELAARNLDDATYTCFLRKNVGQAVQPGVLSSDVARG